VSISEARKDSKSGARERRLEAIIPKETSTTDQMRRGEVSIVEDWLVIERSRIIWIKQTKMERT
jgi:hypothetical protein